jgi:squalene-hopene/tetraprenyl-beta-curcumene cyclase
LWIPLWFGNQSAPNQANPVYGTARVLTGLQRLSSQLLRNRAPMLAKAVGWLLSAQNADGGWGGAKSVDPSVEETALAVDALSELLSGVDVATDRGKRSPEAIRSAVCGGVEWLITKTRQGTSIEASPIGLYFARLWYYEELYPVIFALSALQKARNTLGAI